MKIGKKDAALIFPEAGGMEIAIPNEKDSPEGVGANAVVATVIGIMITSGDKDFKKLYGKYQKMFIDNYKKINEK